MFLWAKFNSEHFYGLNKAKVLRFHQEYNLLMCAWMSFSYAWVLTVCSTNKLIVYTAFSKLNQRHMSHFTIDSGIGTAKLLPIK